jgi:hypothetical protein
MERLAMATKISSFLSGDWIGKSSNQNERVHLARMLLAVYIAHHEGRHISRGEVYNAGHVSPDSGPRYLKNAERFNLVEIKSIPGMDRRTEYVCATDELLRIMESNLDAIIATCPSS